jgi:hypothetical protein
LPLSLFSWNYFYPVPPVRRNPPTHPYPWGIVYLLKVRGKDLKITMEAHGEPDEIELMDIALAFKRTILKESEV